MKHAIDFDSVMLAVKTAGYAVRLNLLSRELEYRYRNARFGKIGNPFETLTLEDERAIRNALREILSLPNGQPFDWKLQHLRQVLIRESPRFHALQRYLSGQKWDGVYRLNHWLSKVFPQASRSRYLDWAGRYLLFGIIQRGLKPGSVLAQYVPVFVGRVGRPFLEEILPRSLRDRFSCELSERWTKRTDIAGQERRVLGSLLVKIPRPSNFLSEGSARLSNSFLTWRGANVKLTSRERDMRAIYVESNDQVPRTFIMAGTDNRLQCLHPAWTRAIPIAVRHERCIGYLLEFRDQLFAEAYYRFRTESGNLSSLDSDRKSHEELRSPFLNPKACLGDSGGERT